MGKVLRSSLIGLALASALVWNPAMNGSVAAQAEKTRVRVEGPFEMESLNPCNNEVVLITGEFKGHGQTVVTPSGVLHIIDIGEAHGTGIGSLGNRYVMTQTGGRVVKDTADQFGPENVVNSFKLIGQGSTPNYVLNTTGHISPNGSFHFNQAGSECRG